MFLADGRLFMTKLFIREMEAPGCMGRRALFIVDQSGVALPDQRSCEVKTEAGNWPSAMVEFSGIEFWKEPEENGQEEPTVKQSMAASLSWIDYYSAQYEEYGFLPKHQWDDFAIKFKSAVQLIRSANGS